MRGAKKSLGNSEGRSQKSGGSSRACSFAGSAYQPKRTVSVSRGGLLEQWERREREKKDKSGLGESDAYRKRSLGEEEVSSVEGAFKKPREKVQGEKANDVDEGGQDGGQTREEQLRDLFGSDDEEDEIPQAEPTNAGGSNWQRER